MKVTKKILSTNGAKEAEIALSAELETTFKNSAIQGYHAAGQLEKAAKNIKKRFLTETKLNNLIAKHMSDIEAHRHFTEDGLDCFIRQKPDYLFETDADYCELKDALDRAKKELEDRKKFLIEKNLVSYETVTYVFECHGEKF